MARDEVPVQVAPGPRIRLDRLAERGDVRRLEVLDEVIRTGPPFKDHNPARVLRIRTDGVAEAAGLVTARGSDHGEVLEHLIAVRPVVEPASDDELFCSHDGPFVTRDLLKLPHYCARGTS